MSWRGAIALAVVFAAGCGNNRVEQNADAFVQRPTIDPVPYYTECVMSNPTACPTPYECTVPDLAHDPTSDVCLVPCTSSEQCPVDHACNGPSVLVESGATNHCVLEP